MRLHQVLTGAANVLDDSVAISHGNIAGFPFTVYGSGYEVVILDSHFNRVQIMSSHKMSILSIVKCISCSKTDGKIAVSFGKKVVLYQAVEVPLSPEVKLPYNWKMMTVISFDSDVQKLCWDLEGERLLVGSDNLHIYKNDVASTSDDSIERWICAWHRRLATPPKHLLFSPDGHYFASCGQGDRMVKIWFRAPKVEAISTRAYRRMHSGLASIFEEDYNFVYMLHPADVLSFSWRNTSKHMPTCSVPNVLLTSCADTVCRIWSETVKYKPSHHTSQHAQPTGLMRPRNISTEKPRSQSDMQSLLEIESGHKLGDHQSYHLISMLHFHLAAVINPSSDIALLSTIPTSSIFGRSFQLHWLNNKEIQFTTAVEAMFESFKRSSSTMFDDDVDSPFAMVDGFDEISFNDDDPDKTLDRTLDEDEIDIESKSQESKSSVTLIKNTEHATEYNVDSNSYKGQLNNLLYKWVTSTDTLFCIHPADGSLLIWIVDYLDNFTSACYRQVQVSFASRIPSTFSKADASSLCWMRSYHYTQPVQKEMKTAGFLFANTVISKSPKPQKESYNELALLQVSYMISAHADGSLNLWLVTLSGSGCFTGIASITHVTRSCGPRFETTQLISHPVLPLVLGTSKRTNGLCEGHSSISDIESELILWHTNHVSPLSEFKGVTEMARISSPNPNLFTCVAWVPTLYQHSLLSVTSNNIELIPDGPCSCFVVASSKGLQLYLVLLDAKYLLSNLAFQNSLPDVPSLAQSLSTFIVSEQSGSHSACIMKLCSLESSLSSECVKFLHVYDKKSLQPVDGVENSKPNSFFVVVVYCTSDGNEYLNIWSVDVAVTNKTSLPSSRSPRSPDSVLSATSPVVPVISSSHCLDLKLVHHKVLFSGQPHSFVPASKLHCSNTLNPSCPEAYNFISFSNREISFWNLTSNEENENNELCSVEIVKYPIDIAHSIVCLCCASTERLACVVENEDLSFMTCIYENQSTGGLKWIEEQHIDIPQTESKSRNVIHLSWMHLENGQYLLALLFNNSVFIYYRHRVEDSTHVARFVWDVLKEIHLFNDKTPLRLTAISWSRGGFFMIGVENEIQVYSQWEDKKEIVFKVPENQPTNSHGVIITKNSFTFACNSMNTLPQYHPDHLMELLNLGKLRRARALLKHLVRCVAGKELANQFTDSLKERPRTRTLTRTFSNLSDLSFNQKEKEIAAPLPTDSAVEYIPPLGLTALHAADKDTSGRTGTNQGTSLTNDYETLFDAKTLSRSFEAQDVDLTQYNSPVHFGVTQAKLLSEQLSRKQLPGLTSQDQMYLLALSDTIATTDFDLEVENEKEFNEGLEDSNLSPLNSGGGGYASSGMLGRGSVDDCGLRYILAARHYTALLKSSPLWKRKILEENGMKTSDICWAFHSECKEQLLGVVPGVSRGSATWKDLRDHGAGWWIRSNDLLKRTIEMVAKTQFQMNQDPLDCAIFYLAMKKKSLVCALYRSLRDQKMSAFFANDFSQERWRKAALKNAYALLGKQRFEHAAAFFLLGNSLLDAVQVCFNRLNDLQLALVLARLFENNRDSHNDILERYVLKEKLHTDPFIHSMTYWTLNDYKQSLEVLLVPSHDSTTSNKYNYPAVFNFYYYLHSHPLLRKCAKDASNLDADQLKMYERQLYFHTACHHLNSGLPDIALEVLSMLPKENDAPLLEGEKLSPTNKMVNSGQIDDFSPSKPVSMDWSSASVDWSLSSRNRDDDDDGYKIDISLEDTSSEEEEEIQAIETTVDKRSEGSSANNGVDIVALNMKFTCVIQCLIENLKALPMKCLHEGTKLRAALNDLLSEELDYLHANCDYMTEEKLRDCKSESKILISCHNSSQSTSLNSTSSASLTYEDLSLGEKVEQVTMHSEWLRTNHSILSSLYDFCSIVGTGDAEVPAVCLELLLMLHEVEDYRVLSAPLTSISAGPSAPPLLLSSMSSFSLVASPTAFLQSMAHDLLQTVINLPVLPNLQNPVTRLADLESLLFSLSLCVYHSLCGGVEDKLLSAIRRGEIQLVGKEFKGRLIRLPHGAADVDLEPTSSPSQWPGVKFFVAILTANSRDRSQHIRFLLCETAVAVYLSMLVSACSRLACSNMHKLVLNQFSEEMWGKVFGGATKVVIPTPEELSRSSSASPTPDNKRDTTRMKWNYKLLGKRVATQSSSPGEENKKLVRHEVFLLPKCTLCDYFLKKPSSSDFPYDSDDEKNESDSDVTDSEDEEDPLKDDLEESNLSSNKKKNAEHYDSESYPWLVMQLALVKLSAININTFISMAGLDVSDLPTQSLLLYNATKILQRWEQLLVVKLASFPAMTQSLIEYFPSNDGVQRGGVALQRMKAMLDPNNTPFRNRTSKSLPAKRLWHALVQQEPLRSMFLHYAFMPTYDGDDETDFETLSGRVLHKDPESVTNFCLNKVNMSYVAISTTHEIIEYDISGSLKLPLYTASEDTYNESENEENKERKSSVPTVIQRRPCSGVRRMDSHPHLPYYVSGGADGSVRMWEFLHPNQIHSFRGAGQNERVNKIQFYAHGNKFAVVDDSGYLSMWMITSTHSTVPFLTLRCHTKYCMDFAYLGSSSLIATVGFTNDKKNICIWDTLLPTRSALIHSFSHNVHGANCLAYMPGQQSLISGGKRGDICIFDIRQRRLLHTFQAHDAVIKTIVIDPANDLFVSGAIDGDLKVWGLSTHELLESFLKEHSRATVSLRQVSPGVQCLELLPGYQLFSCGGDGTVKWRMLNIKGLTGLIT